MKIVVVDTVSLQAHHLKALRSLGDLTVYTDVPTRPELERRVRGADVAIVGWSTIDASILAGAPSLKLIALWSTGYDHVDAVAARERGISVTNVPGYAAGTIAEFVIGAIIALSRRFMGAHRHVLDGQYEWREFSGSEIREKTLGIIGTGAIGSRVAQVAHSLGMRVIASTCNPSDHRAANLGVRYVPLSDLLAESDVVSVHSALTPETRGLLGTAEFALMKPGAFFVNTARAEIVDQKALESALLTGHLGGVALDVIDGVPLPADHPFRTHPNVILTPHCAFNTQEATLVKTDICISNVERFIKGEPRNVVN